MTAMTHGRVASRGSDARQDARLQDLTSRHNKPFDTPPDREQKKKNEESNNRMNRIIYSVRSPRPGAILDVETSHSGNCVIERSCRSVCVIIPVDLLPVDLLVVGIPTYIIIL